jgi:broad specificity phosphatase PhoE
VDRRSAPAGAELHDEVLARMNAAVARAVSGMKDHRSMLLVSHGSSIRIWLSSLTGQAARALGNGEVLRFALTDGGLRHVE